LKDAKDFNSLNPYLCIEAKRGEMAAPVFDLIMHIIAFLIGAGIVIYTLSSAIHTFVLPRADSKGLTHFVFRFVRKIFDWRTRRKKTYLARDRVMALYAPVALMTLLPTWYLLVVFGYTLMFWAIGVDSWYLAFATAGHPY